MGNLSAVVSIETSGARHGLALLLLVLGVLAGAPRLASAQGIDETCVVALVKSDPTLLNIAYPDDSAQYYFGVAQIAPGTRVRISGRFPHARYMSFNVYDPALRPVDAITDVDIVPEAGSTNPFRTGADRTASRRSYTVTIEPGAKPANPAPNTLYAGSDPSGAPTAAPTFLYRIYLPDPGTGDDGGVGVPTVQIEPATTTESPSSPSPCATAAKPTIAGINETLAAASPPVDPPQPGGTNPPVWRKFVNVLSAVGVNVTGSPSPGGLDLDTLGGSGGFLSNKDNAYVSAPTTRGFGQVLVTRFRAPTFPDTRGGATRMPGGQLRYWSLCQNDPPTQRYVACVNDDRAVLGADGFATFVVSTAGRRPATATRACGVNWMPWGANTKGLPLYRNMLPAADFGASVQAATVDHEGATMHEYLPVSRYYADRAAYEKAVPCVAPGTAAPKVPCASRRLIELRLHGRAARLRRVAVRIGGRRAVMKTVRRGTVAIDLRRLPRGTYAVRVSSGGRTLARRTYRTCTSRRAWAARATLTVARPPVAPSAADRRRGC
jgi:hypothetical protein